MPSVCVCGGGGWFVGLHFHKDNVLRPNLVKPESQAGGSQQKHELLDVLERECVQPNGQKEQ